MITFRKVSNCITNDSISLDHILNQSPKQRLSLHTTQHPPVLTLLAPFELGACSRFTGNGCQIISELVHKNTMTLFSLAEQNRLRQISGLALR